MKDIEMKKLFQRRPRPIDNQNERAVPGNNMHKTALVRTSCTQQICEISGHEVGGTRSITVSCSIRKVIGEFKAASNYFRRASVRNPNGVEFSFALLLRRAQQQRKAAYTRCDSPLRPNILGEC